MNEMSVAMFADVPGLEPPRPPSHTDLYLGGAWVIGAFIVVAALQIVTLALIALFYFEFRRKRQPTLTNQSGTLPAPTLDARSAISTGREPTTQRMPPAEKVIGE